MNRSTFLVLLRAKLKRGQRIMAGLIPSQEPGLSCASLAARTAQSCGGVSELM